MIDILGLGSVAEILVSLPLSVKMKALFTVSFDHGYQRNAFHVLKSVTARHLPVNLSGSCTAFKMLLRFTCYRVWHISKVVFNAPLCDSKIFFLIPVEMHWGVC